MQVYCNLDLSLTSNCVQYCFFILKNTGYMLRSARIELLSTVHFTQLRKLEMCISSFFSFYIAFEFIYDCYVYWSTLVFSFVVIIFVFFYYWRVVSLIFVRSLHFTIRQMEAEKITKVQVCLVSTLPLLCRQNA